MENKCFEESGYRFSFPSAQMAIKADSKNYAQLSSVDFIVETDSEFYFIEVKNPDNPKARPQSQADFLAKLKSDIFPDGVVKKFSDTLLARLAMGHSFPKPIRYIFILEFRAFSSYERQRLLAKVRNKLPVGLKDGIFVNVSRVQGFELLTVDKFREQYPSFFIETI